MIYGTTDSKRLKKKILLEEHKNFKQRDLKTDKKCVEIPCGSNEHFLWSLPKKKTSPDMGNQEEGNKSGKPTTCLRHFPDDHSFYVVDNQHSLWLLISSLIKLITYVISSGDLMASFIFFDNRENIKSEVKSKFSSSEEPQGEEKISQSERKENNFHFVWSLVKKEPRK